MRLFTTLNNIINVDTISSLNTDRGIVNLIDGNKISLSNDELRDLKSVLFELQRQARKGDN